MTPPEYAEADQRALKEISDTGVCAAYEKEWVCKDGTRVPILLGAAIFEDNTDEGVCFVLDLTERKKARTAVPAGAKDGGYRAACRRHRA